MITFASRLQRPFWLLLVGCILTYGVALSNEETRNVRGTIYFSNNTPDNLDDFPVELFTGDQKSRVAETTLTKSGNFFLADIKPGKYVLKITNPGQCTLLYRVDLSSRSITNIRVVMDAACAHTNGKLEDLPKN
ncbi:MAG TPA: hypothetical protein VI306_23500 [Pyrinomonadaceae bacterium]